MKKRKWKAETIKACHEIKKKYLDYDGSFDALKYFFNINHCKLCIIYYIGKSRPDEDTFHSCGGCFMSNENEQMGCGRFKSFKKAIECYSEFYIYENINPAIKAKTIDAFRKRAAFFERIIPILETHPEEDFSPKTWRSGCFDDIKTEW